MQPQTTFKRYEMKYMLTIAQYKALQQVMESRMERDSYGKHTIHNVYYDTPDFLLIRRSLEKPQYKEKLRVRCYGEPKTDSTAFIEVKKKYDGVVYKRRLSVKQSQVLPFLMEHQALAKPSQIGNEIDYFMHMYGNLQPAVALRYEREAYFDLAGTDFRMTFDQNISINPYDDPAHESAKRYAVIPAGNVLLEVKTAMGLPTWLLGFFADNGIFRQSFSKYGTAYQNILLPQQIAAAQALVQANAANTVVSMRKGGHTDVA